MALSPNYSWAEPDNSSLVKNGASDIRTLGDAIDTSVWNIGYGQAGKNLLINGDCSIAQRGTSFTATGYTLDRWKAPITGTVTVSQETSDLPTSPAFRYGIKSVTGAAASFAQFQQALETTTVVGLRGLTLTISGYIKITGGYTGNWLVQKYYSTSTDTLTSQTTQIGSNVTIATSATSTWTKFTDTFTVPTDANGLLIQFAPNSAQASGVTVRMTGFQLEVGSKSTPFSRAGGTIQGELLNCQRYFQVLGNLFGYANSTTTIQGSIASAQMRTTPTAALTTATPTGESPINVTAVTAAASTTAGSGNLNQYGSQFIRVTGFTGLTINAFSYVTAGQITLSAEL